MRTSPLVAVTTLVLGSLLGASTSAVAAPADAPPPRTSASVSDPAYDSTGTDPNRRSRADVRKVDYVMPTPRAGRQLYIGAEIRRVGLADTPQNAPAQQVKTLIDGPGVRDYAVTFYNGPRSPRVVSLAGDEPRRITPSGAIWTITPGRNGVLDVSMTTEWLRAGDRADFSATGISREATDTTRTAPRLNTRYAGESGASGRSGGARGTYADPACTAADDGALSCSYGTL